MERNEKQELIGELNEVFANAESVVVVHYDGLTVAEITALRAQMREVGATLKVTKNRLTRLALKDTEYEGLADLFTGPTAVGYADDVVAPAKAIAEFAKNNEKLRIIGGGMGSTVLDVAGVQALATMPSLDELRGKLIGVLSAPAQKVAAVTAAPAGQLARVFSAYGEKDAA
ncbi:50S ribosomal protein L10 [Temperatibacter marinus]|uniref:Large ribosomal subunit protein uL10 n=1 Tax=Temperatibacter marinus TaxID=1456591 RepID=A0AA52EIS2_9PROT|nr:50S ribosomal protein L10 [Temperatibacter marinus]WND02801.1 50S ribosomal protein L10 [Temperatibacter marinus]